MCVYIYTYIYTHMVKQPAVAKHDWDECYTERAIATICGVFVLLKPSEKQLLSTGQALDPHSFDDQWVMPVQQPQ